MDLFMNVHCDENFQIKAKKMLSVSMFKRKEINNVG